MVDGWLVSGARISCFPIEWSGTVGEHAWRAHAQTRTSTAPSAQYATILLQFAEEMPNNFLSAFIAHIHNTLWKAKSKWNKK